MFDQDFIPFITFSILVQCAFSIVYLSTYQWSKNKWLVLFFLIVLIAQLGVLFDSASFSPFQKVFIGNPGLLMAVSPCLYLFTKDLILEGKKDSINFLHFLPAFLFCSTALFYDNNQPRVIMREFAQGNFHPISILLMLGLFTINFFYGISILQLIKKNQKLYKDEYAESSIYLTLDWLKYLIIFLVFMSFIITVAVFGAQYFSKMNPPQLYVEFIILLNILAFSYFAFRQPTLYREPRILESIESEKGSETKTSKPLLDQQKITTISKDLDLYLTEKLPYLNPKIRMPEIAAAIDISPNEFSWYLNEYKKTNFFTFINELRAKYAAQLLKNDDYQHYTLEAVGEMAGFKSKTTFYNRFKEIQNVTPSAYRKSMLIH